MKEEKFDRETQKCCFAFSLPLFSSTSCSVCIQSAVKHTVRGLGCCCFGLRERAHTLTAHTGNVMFSPQRFTLI